VAHEGGKVVTAAAFTLKKYSWYSLLLGARGG